MSPISVRAFAKINLSLHVMAKRPDGFHEVRTILQSIDLADRLRVQPTRGPFQIVCATPGVPAGRTNLVWRAAEGLWNAAGREGEPRGATVHLDKRIPMQAGLGGGSSDAAAALLVLRGIWNVKVDDQAVSAIAARLGSDVPYFLVGGTALALGRGEEVYPLADLPRWWVVLAMPPFGIATADAYAWLDETRARSLGAAAFAADAASAAKAKAARGLPGTWLERVAHRLANDLERPVVEHHPAIGALIDQLNALGASLAAMSGSGSTVFGMFTTAERARRAAAHLRRAGVTALVARLLKRPNPEP